MMLYTKPNRPEGHDGIDCFTSYTNKRCRATEQTTIYMYSEARYQSKPKTHSLRAEVKSISKAK